jgi:HTH-type transcriptional regulator/antitoxin HipB
MSSPSLDIRTLLLGRQMVTQSGRSETTAFRVYSPGSLGAAIRHYRREAGLTQAQLAARAGINRTYLADLERGRETEQVRRILRVLRQLGVRMRLEEADW